MRFGKSFLTTPAVIRTTALLVVAGCAPTAPQLLRQVPPRAASFSLSDSTEVVRRVQQVFSCATPASSLPYLTLGWRRDSTFVDITLVQDLLPPGPNGEPSRVCWKGFRVDAAGQIYILPLRNWPYSSFRKRPPKDLHLAAR